MSEINFLPVCSNCREILDYEDIAVVRGYSIIGSASDFLRIPEDSVQPFMCPKCGEHFERITLPSGLPFYARRRKDSFL